MERVAHTEKAAVGGLVPSRDATDGPGGTPCCVVSCRIGLGAHVVAACAPSYTPSYTFPKHPCPCHEDRTAPQPPQGAISATGVSRLSASERRRRSAVGRSAFDAAGTSQPTRCGDADSLHSSDNGAGTATLRYGLETFALSPSLSRRRSVLAAAAVSVDIAEHRPDRIRPVGGQGPQAKVRSMS
jgi:hypothetical protein